MNININVTFMKILIIFLLNCIFTNIYSYYCCCCLKECLVNFNKNYNHNLNNRIKQLHINIFINININVTSMKILIIFLLNCIFTNIYS